MICRSEVKVLIGHCHFRKIEIGSDASVVGYKRAVRNDAASAGGTGAGIFATRVTELRFSNDAARTAAWGGAIASVEAQTHLVVLGGIHARCLR